MGVIGPTVSLTNFWIQVVILRMQKGIRYMTLERDICTAILSLWFINLVARFVTSNISEVLSPDFEKDLTTINHNLESIPKGNSPESVTQERTFHKQVYLNTSS